MTLRDIKIFLLCYKPMLKIYRNSIIKVSKDIYFLYITFCKYFDFVCF